MRWPHFSLLIFISLALAALQEVLYQRSDKQGGLIVFKSINEVSVGEVGVVDKLTSTGMLTIFTVFSLAVCTHFGSGHLRSDG